MLRTLVPSGKTEGAVVWHIHPNLIPNWTRPPMVAHSQVGYPPGFPKVAVIELDPNYDAPETAKVLRLDADGSYKQVFEGPISAPTPWLRYRYAKFDFSRVMEPGLYAIEYAGERTDQFPIARDVYSRTWQSSLDGFLAVEMDHLSVREGYRLWHGVSHMDDARQAPPNTQHFDGYSMGPNTDSPYKPGEHIPGLAVGGWFDAGDYDNIAPSQYSVIQNLSLAYKEFGLTWDELSVDETSRTVEMHRPDGVPDAVQQVKHGVLQVLAQYKSIGHPIMGMIEPTLREYTHLGDAASITDERIYSDRLGPNVINGNYSGKPDDRWAFTTKMSFLQYGAAASLASASQTLKGFDDPLAKESLETAIKLWDEEHAHPTPTEGQRFGPPGMGAIGEWSAAVQLLIATDGAEPYKTRVTGTVPHRAPAFCPRWMDGRSDAAVHGCCTSSSSSKRRSNPTRPNWMPSWRRLPSAVPPSLGTWGGSCQVAEFWRANVLPARSISGDRGHRTIRCGPPTTCWARIRSRARRTFPRSEQFPR